MHAIQILKSKYQLPIDVRDDEGNVDTSLIRCVQMVGAFEMSDQQYVAAINELLNTSDVIPASVKHLPKYLFGYIVQNSLKAYLNKVEITDVLTTSTAQALKYIQENPWVFATGEDENAPRKLDAAGNIAPAKGDKKVMAKELWTKHNGIQGTVNTRKLWIELLVAQVGMTAQGASTYYHNLKTGVY